MNKYKHSKIYKIVNDVDDMVYIGSTFRPLQKRWKGHIQTLNNNTSQCKNYEHMRNIGIEHFRIILICEYPCTNKHELLWKETEEIKKIQKHKKLNTNTALFKLTDEREKNKKVNMMKYIEKTIRNVEQIILELF